MRSFHLAVLLALLTACGDGNIMRPPGSPTTPPSQPPTETFTLTADPFSLPRGRSAPLTVRVTFNSSSISRVALRYQSNTRGLEVTPVEQNAQRGSSSTQTVSFTVTDRDVDPQEKKPFFYIYGIACTSNGCSSQSQKSLTIQWNMP